MLKRRFVGRGMHLEFCHPEYQTPIVTSRIQEIREPKGCRSGMYALDPIAADTISPESANREGSQS